MATDPIKKLNVKNKWFWLGGGAATLTVIYIYKKRQEAVAASTTVDTTAVDPNAIDPTLNGDAGFSPASGGAFGSTPGSYGFIDGTTGQFIGLGGSSGGVVTGPANNGQWAQQAEAYLVQNGFDMVAVAIALGKYLQGAELTADEMATVQAAIAFEGNPPTAVPPPHQAPPAGQNTGSGTLAAPHLGVASHTTKTAMLKWNAVAGASSYHVHRSNGTFLTVKGTSHNVNRPGAFTVVAVDSHGKGSPASNSVTV